MKDDDDHVDDDSGLNERQKDTAWREDESIKEAGDRPARTVIN